MLKRELEILLNDANLAIKDLEQENTNLKSRNEALTKFIAATALNITGEVEPVKKAVADIRVALTGATEGDTAILDTIRNIISRLELRND
ncbi:MAG: hypothetical protein IKH71_17795 [Oscillospiraceae bacterium]|nr:hypothetical protein [Oscillospiraceae bacterium]MBR6834518.1 hypothetical protein [Oscillospiraceae bacterium]